MILCPRIDAGERVPLLNSRYSSMALRIVISGFASSAERIPILYYEVSNETGTTVYIASEV